MFADFVASFEDARVAGKTFVRGNTINPETKGKIFSKLIHVAIIPNKKWTYLSVFVLYLKINLKEYFIDS